MSENERAPRFPCMVNALGKMSWPRRTCTVCVLCAATAMALPAQTLTTLHSFDGTDGASAYALVQATNGDGYGTTQFGGTNANCPQSYGCGTIFKITPSGKLTTLYNFCSQQVGSLCTDGQGPSAGLVLAVDGNLYGTTEGGGANGGGAGTVFKITASGKLTTLYSFCAETGCMDGEYPYAGLIQATNGNFYGTTMAGGANPGYLGGGGGTVFKITPSGKLTTLYSFCAQTNCTDGFFPTGLVQATDGNFYGTTEYGGANGDYGTVFKITPSGKLMTLYNFCFEIGCPDGASPLAGLIQGVDGDFYGTTSTGGHNCSYFEGTPCGTVFKITPTGTLTTLYNFCFQGGCRDGAKPFALVQATDGNFYGTTEDGGIDGGEGACYGCGTVFKITLNGTLTTLYSFCAQAGCTDGEYPQAGLVQATNGDFYGTTYQGGTFTCPLIGSGCGTVFSLSVGLGPFVRTLPTSSKVGAAVKVLGTNLTGATSVTFNGTAAVFTVMSRSLITTTVPAGATTGTVQVVTPGGTLSSNVAFRVRP